MKTLINSFIAPIRWALIQAVPMSATLVSIHPDPTSYGSLRIVSPVRMAIICHVMMTVSSPVISSNAPSQDSSSRYQSASPANPVHAEGSSWGSMTLDELDERLKTLAQALVQEDWPSREFAQIIQQPAGRIAISNALAKLEQQLHNQASEAALSEYLQHQINSDLLKQLERDVRQAENDISQVALALNGFNNKLQGKSEADQLTLRLLNLEQAPTVFYFSRIRQQLRPNYQMIMRRLGRFLAEDDDGSLIVRPSAKDNFVRSLETYDQMNQMVTFIREESCRMSEEVAEQDELHRQLKARLASGSGAPLVVVSLAEQPGSMQEKLPRYFEYVESLLLETSDGLVIKDDMRDRLAKGMAESSRQVENAQRLRVPLAEIAERIDIAAGKPEQELKQFLDSEIGLFVIAKMLNLAAADATTITENFKTEFFETTEDGLMIKNKRRAEATQLAREMLRNRRR